MNTGCLLRGCEKRGRAGSRKSTSSCAKGATHTSLGQRPRFPRGGFTRAESPTHRLVVKSQMDGAFSPLSIHSRHLGRCPRAGMGYAFGAPETDFRCTLQGLACNPVFTMNTTRFPSTLAAFQRRWRAALLVSETLRARAWTALALVVLGVFDFYAGFTDPARRVAFAALLAVAVCGLLGAFWKVFAFRHADAAITADGALAGGRRGVLPALELASANSAPATPLGAWLRERMRGLRFTDGLPRRAFALAFRWLVCAAALVVACALFAPAP